jgi:hypothetical protein
MLLKEMRLEKECQCSSYSDGSLRLCQAHAEAIGRVTERLNAALELVNQQAEDEALWLVRRPFKESDVAFLQEALRALHMVIEEGTFNPFGHLN